MTKKSSDRHQSILDIERLRKAAERIGRQQDALDDALERLEMAAEGLRFIAKRANISYAGSSIYQRALDTLRLIGEK